jgi:hypothetical protein
LPYSLRVTAMLQTTDLRETRDAARELKFLVATDRSSALLDWARARLKPDPHAGGPNGDEYYTSTLYFDTADQAVYRRVGSYGRSKYRIRRYGDSGIVFLERKLRTRALLSKRRSVVPVAALPGLFPAPGTAPKWFAERVAMRRLLPTCQVSYRRHAYIGEGPYGLMRLTFDDQIRAQPNGTTMFASADGVPVNTGGVIIEMKFCVETPAVLKQFVEEFSLSPAPVSKYRLAVDTLAKNHGAVPANLQRVAAALSAASGVAGA